MITFWFYSYGWEPDLIIPDKEYASLETVAMALELVPASKRLLGSDNPQGNSELPRSQAALGKYNPRPIHTWSAWACLTCDQWNRHTIGLGLKNVLGVYPCQGPRPSGPKAVSCSCICVCVCIYIYIYIIYKLFLWFRRKYVCMYCASQQNNWSFWE